MFSPLIDVLFPIFVVPRILLRVPSFIQLWLPFVLAPLLVQEETDAERGPKVDDSLVKRALPPLGLRNVSYVLRASMIRDPKHFRAAIGLVLQLRRALRMIT